jgi:hypothetical protein
VALDRVSRLEHGVAALLFHDFSSVSLTEEDLSTASAFRLSAMRRKALRFCARSSSDLSTSKPALAKEDASRFSPSRQIDQYLRTFANIRLAQG